jgi:hypothetical protein
MDRRTAVVVERLEERALLSSIAYSLTTSQSIYQVGRPVNLTFTETNTGDEPVTVSISPTDFTVSQNNSALWQSGPTGGNVPPKSETLAPGQSLSQTASWDGIWDDPLPYGQSPSTIFPISAYGTFTVSNPNDPQGLNATFQIANPIVYSVTTNQSVYQLGEPIQITWSAVNTADQPITILGNPTNGLSVTHNGTLVSSHAAPDITAFPVTFAVGQTETGQETWNGLPYSGPYTVGDLTGTFIAGYGPFTDPTQYATPFQIEAPPAGELVTSVTANQATYQSGKSINLTFTETNDGDQPIAVLIGTTEFEVTEAGSTAEFFVAPTGATEWTTAGNPPTQVLPTWFTLKPGQSYTQTATWQNLEVPTTTTFTVSNLLDPNDSSATFQVLSTPPPSQPNQNAGSSASSATSYPVAAALLAQHPSYKLGESVHMSLILKDVSASKVAAVKQSGGVETLTVQRGSTMVYESVRKAPVLPLQMIKTGHPLELTTVWSGKANRAGIKKLTPGTYTITVDDAGYVASTAVQLTACRK